MHFHLVGSDLLDPPQGQCDPYSPQVLAHLNSDPSCCRLSMSCKVFSCHWCSLQETEKQSLSSLIFCFAMRLDHYKTSLKWWPLSFFSLCNASDKWLYPPLRHISHSQEWARAILAVLHSLCSLECSLHHPPQMCCWVHASYLLFQ